MKSCKQFLLQDGHSRDRFSMVSAASGIGNKFNPGQGGLMKEWLAVRANAASHWPNLAREALHFVGGAK